MNSSPTSILPGMPAVRPKAFPIVVGCGFLLAIVLFFALSSSNTEESLRSVEYEDYEDDEMSEGKERYDYVLQEGGAEQQLIQQEFDERYRSEIADRSLDQLDTDHRDDVYDAMSVGRDRGDAVYRDDEDNDEDDELEYMEDDRYDDNDDRYDTDDVNLDRLFGDEEDDRNGYDDHDLDRLHDNDDGFETQFDTQISNDNDGYLSDDLRYDTSSSQRSLYREEPLRLEDLPHEFDDRGNIVNVQYDEHNLPMIDSRLYEQSKAPEDFDPAILEEKRRLHEDLKEMKERHTVLQSNYDLDQAEREQRHRDKAYYRLSDEGYMTDDELNVIHEDVFSEDTFANIQEDRYREYLQRLKDAHDKLKSTLDHYSSKTKLDLHDGPDLFNYSPEDSRREQYKSQFYEEEGAGYDDDDERGFADTVQQLRYDDDEDVDEDGGRDLFR